MKLKKIASLMLAGVMAVSMLAGCSGKGTTDPENPGNPVVPETGIVAAVNDGQNAANAVKIDFTSSSSLDALLSSAVKAFGEKSSDTNLTKRIADLTGMETDMSQLQKYTGMRNTSDVARNTNKVADNADGVVVEAVCAFTVTGAFSEDVAMKQAADSINNVIKDMKATSYKKDATMGGQDYCDYSYTGNVSMVSVEKADGTTIYCFAYTIAQTTHVETLAPAEA